MSQQDVDQATNNTGDILDLFDPSEKELLQRILEQIERDAASIVTQLIEIMKELLVPIAVYAFGMLIPVHALVFAVNRIKTCSDIISQFSPAEIEKLKIILPKFIEQLQKALLQAAQQTPQQQQLDINQLANLVAERLRENQINVSKQNSEHPTSP